MLIGQPQIDEFGFSITSPFKKVASVVKSGAKVVYKAHEIPTKYAIKATKTSAKYAGKGAVVAGKAIYQAHAIPTKWLAVKPTEWLAHKAIAPVKSRVQTIVNRRARKLAWDRRKSKTPTPAEHAEARTWTRNRLLAMSVIVPAAPILAAFAGAPVADAGLGVAPAVVAAAVPVLMAAAAAILSQLNKPNDAPANPEAGGGGPPGMPGAGPAPGEAPAAPGEVDLAPVQQAAADAAAEGAAAMQQVAERAGGKPRGIGGISKKHMLIGGAILGGVLLLAMMKPKS